MLDQYIYLARGRMKFYDIWLCHEYDPRNGVGYGCEPFDDESN